MAWMAWTWPTAAFFVIVAAVLGVMSFLAIRYPEMPKQGVLGIATTRGDRLFITLLASAFLNLAWLWFGLGPQWIALILCAALAAAIFRFV